MQHPFFVLASAATAGAAYFPAPYGPPGNYSSPPGGPINCTALSTVTNTSTAPSHSSAEPGTPNHPWFPPYHGGRPATVTITPSCPGSSDFALAPSSGSDSSSSCPSPVTVTATPPWPSSSFAPRSYCPGYQNTTKTFTLNATTTQTALITVTQTITSTLVENITTTTTTSRATVTAAPTPLSPIYPSSVPSLELFTFDDLNCAFAGVDAIGFPPDIPRYLSSLNSTLPPPQAPCTPLTDLSTSYVFNVIGKLPATGICFLTFYSDRRCLQQVVGQAAIPADAGVCQSGGADARGFAVFC